MSSTAAARQAVMLEFSTLGSTSTCTSGNGGGGGTCPLGMYVLPSQHDIFTWQCVLFIHRGYFRDAVLRFNLKISPTYPSNKPPLIHFKTNVFHPLIDPTNGEFTLKSKFPTWSSNGKDYLFQVLHYVKSSFKREGLESIQEEVCLNKEAYKIYHNQINLFAKLASQTAALSITPESLYSSSSGGIRFKLLENEEEKETLLNKLKNEARSRLVGIE